MPKVTTVTARGPVVQDLRERTGLSRMAFGEKLGLSHESIRRIELCRPIGRLTLCRVANALKVNVDELIRSEPKTADEEPEVAA